MLMPVLICYGTGVWAGVVVRSARLSCLGVPITRPDRRAGCGAAAARVEALLLPNLVLGPNAMSQHSVDRPLRLDNRDFAQSL